MSLSCATTNRSFFKEIESELLQSDITEDSAATALLNYLTKLEEVAILEPCGIYHVEADTTKVTDDIDHVVARTAGANRKYYYRRREFGYWTPWEAIKLDIEDNPVIPVVWNERLFLFWVRILKQAPVDPNALPTTSPPGVVGSLTLQAIKNDARNNAQDNARVKIQAVLCWSEYYNGKWQPTKTSDIDNPAELGRFAAAGNDTFDRSKLRLLSHEVEGTEALAIRIDGQGGATYFLNNTHSLPQYGDDAIPLFDIPLLGPTRHVDVSSKSVLEVSYSDGLLHFDPTGALVGQQPLDRIVLQNRYVDCSIEPRHVLADTWRAPFFYRDSRHVFYVTTATEISSIGSHPGYGITIDPGLVTTTQVPPLIIKIVPDPPVPRFWGDGDLIGPDIGVSNPNPVRQFMSVDANIRQGLGTTGSVRFGDRLIGPAGGFSGNGRKA